MRCAFPPYLFALRRIPITTEAINRNSKPHTAQSTAALSAKIRWRCREVSECIGAASGQGAEILKPGKEVFGI
jgi:hypothetical protein